MNQEKALESVAHLESREIKKLKQHDKFVAVEGDDNMMGL